MPPAPEAGTHALTGQIRPLPPPARRHVRTAASPAAALALLRPLGAAGVASVAAREAVTDTTARLS